jgi:hypothetical protein
MAIIRPIKDLRNTNGISELCHVSEEPVYITKNGYGDMVVMSMETYERQFALADVYRKLAAAEIQVADGFPLLDGEGVFRKLRGKHAE